MNKKYLSILVIVITLILSIYMIVSQNNNNDFTLVDSAKKFEAESVNQNLDEKIELFLKNIDKEKNTNNNVQEKQNNQNSKNNDDIKNITKDTESEKKIREIEKLEKEQIEFKNNAQDEIFKEKEESSMSTPVFKMDKMLILEDMTFSDKAIITKMITKLSMQDYELIIDNIKKYGELECVEKINHILKSRLDEDDYKTIEGIFDKYINLELFN